MKCDIILHKLINKEISQYEARKQIFGDSEGIFKCPENSEFDGTLIVTKGKRCLEIHWCLGSIAELTLMNKIKGAK